MRILILAIFSLLVLTGPDAVGTAFASEDPVWTKGTVTKVKPDQGKVMIRHEEITNLDMPAMKMSFGVEDPAILEQLKPGDEVEFYFVKEKGRFIVKQVRR